MTDPHAPIKTALGLEELRLRTRRLSQRHRTVLLLVDGQRSLGEVLGMANKAGAQTQHFEELVKLGLVAVPAAVAAPEPAEPEVGLADAPVIQVLVDELSEPGVAAAEAPVAGPSDAVDGFEPTAQDAGPERPLRAEDGAGPAVAEAPSALPDVPAPSAPPAPRPAGLQTPRESPFTVADHARAAPRMTEAQRLQYVRDLLLDTLRRDALLFSTFSVSRVRVAQTQRELINLVWEIERDRAHIRRTREQLLNLQRARELLGMGNTLVAGDSLPGLPSEF